MLGDPLNSNDSLKIDFLYCRPRVLKLKPTSAPNCIYIHTNNQQDLKSGHLSNELDTLVQ